MKFALFILASWTEKDAGAQSRIYGEAVEQIQYAEEGGFESVWIAEHHSSPYGNFPSLPFPSEESARASPGVRETRRSGRARRRTGLVSSRAFLLHRRANNHGRTKNGNAGRRALAVDSIPRAAR